jgi:UDP-glucose 4-epimerase
MRIAVTGGAGFLGRSTIAFGQAAGHEMHAIDRNATGRAADFEDWRADVTNWDVLADVLDTIRPDHVIHLAGVLGTAELFDDANRAVQVNVGGALNVIQWCTEQQAGYTTITMPDSGWANVYAATKGCAVTLAEAYRRHKGLRVSNVCAYNAYGPAQAHGPGHPQKIIPTFARWAWNGEAIQVWGDGEQTVDLVHADDIARMLIDATAFGDGETFDAGTGEALTVNQVADYVNEVCGNLDDADRSPRIEYLPMRAGEDPGTEIVATGRGWDLLGWHPVMDWSLLRECIESYRVTE